MLVRPLTVSDAAAYVALRREMLHDSPWAFSSSPEDDQALDAAFVGGQLSKPDQAIVGAFDDDDGPATAGALVASAGLFRDRHLKKYHRAHVWGVYVAPRARGRGVGAQVLTRTLEVARSWPGISIVVLSVSVRSEGAKRLYERLGFITWGREPRVVSVGGTTYDDFHMVKFLDRP